MQTIVSGRWNKHSSLYPETKNLWAVRNRYDAGRTSLTELQLAEDAVVKLLIHELELCGVSVLTDGNIRWDSIFDLARSIKGCSGFIQLTRIPETNHFHRQPVVELPLVHQQPLLLHDLEFAKKCTSQPLIFSLPGPYSLARQTKNFSDIGLEKLAYSFAEVLNAEVRLLLKNGAAFVRIEESQILVHPEDFLFFEKIMEKLVYGADEKYLLLSSWFGDIASLPQYFKLPFGVFALDLVEGKKNLEMLKYFPPGKKLIAGIFDARHTYDDRSEILTEIMNKVLDYVPADDVMVSANTDFHFLPWDKSLKKVRAMVEFAKFFGNFSIKPTRPISLSSVWIKPESCEKEPLSGTNQVNIYPLPHISYPTSTVGSFPQNNEIREARARLRKREIDKKVYLDIVASNIKLWMDFQKEIGIIVPVGGEFLREDMAVYFGLNFGGRTLDFVPSYENRRYRPVECHGEVFNDKPILVNDFLQAQSLTSCSVKETITGPATLADWAVINFDKYYNDCLRFRMDLACAIRKEITFLKEAGVKILQLDEPALTTKMKNFFWDLEAIYETVRGFDKEMYLVLHICYSDMAALDVAFPYILKLPFHQIHIEMANRNYEPFAFIEKYGFASKDVGLGVIDVHTDRIETVNEIVRGVKMARNFFTPDQIWLTPDCGLKERDDKIAKKKLKVMTEAAKICRDLLP